MNMQQLFYLSGIIGGFVGMIFSGFMMYSMFRVKKNADKISEDLKTFTQQAETIANNILPMLSGSNSPDQKIITSSSHQDQKEIRIEDLLEDKIIFKQKYYLDDYSGEDLLDMFVTLNGGEKKSARYKCSLIINEMYVSIKFVDECKLPVVKTNY